MVYSRNTQPVFLLGTINFKIDVNVTPFRENSRNVRGELPEDVHYVLNDQLNRFEDKLRLEFGVPFTLSGGSVSPGSIIFRDGEIIIKSRAIAALLLVYGFVGDYPDLRAGAIALTTDIAVALQNAATYVHAIELEYTAPDPDRLVQHIEVAMPPTLRRLINEKRDRFPHR